MADDPTIIGSIGATLAIEYGLEIDPNVVSQIPFDSPIYDYLEAGVGAPRRKLGKAATFGILTAADFTSSHDGTFTCGGDPPGITTDRELKAIAKKCYGALGGVKDVDIIASSMAIAPHNVSGLDAVSMRYRNDAEFLLNMLYVRTRQAIDWGIIRGNTGTNTKSFDGLEYMVTAANGSQVLAVSGAFAKGHLDELIIQMMMKGIIPTAIACNPIMLSTLIDTYTGSGDQVSINMNMGDQDVALGYWAKRIVTPAGILPIVQDRRFSVSGTAPTFTGDIFVLTREHMGEYILGLEWQVMPSALDLARVPGFYTSQVFAVWSSLTLVEKADWFAQGRLTDVVVTYRPTPPTPTA